MNRRGFIARLCALAAAPFASFFAFTKAVSFTENVGTHDYIAIMHPDCYQDFVSITARGRWKDAYREARCAGYGDMPAREISAKYGKHLSYVGNDEIGSFEGIRFITMRNLGNV